MTPGKAKHLGRRFSFISALIIFMTFQLIFLISETKNDFANGILFYIDKQMNPITALAFLIFFLSFILFGHQAGPKIIIQKVNSIKIAFIYGFVTAILMATYFAIPFFKGINNSNGIYSETDLIQMKWTFLLFTILMLLLFLSGWFLTTYRLSQVRNKSYSS